MNVDARQAPGKEPRPIRDGGRDDSSILEIERLTRVGLRGARRLAILALGSAVVLVGIAMILLPGPAFIVIPAGLSILAIEFRWAQRCLDVIKGWMHRFGRRARTYRWGKKPQERDLRGPSRASSSPAAPGSNDASHSRQSC